MTPLQKSIAEIEAWRSKFTGVDYIVDTCINILTDNLEYERGEIMRAFEFSANLKTDLSASDYYTKTYNNERKD